MGACLAFEVSQCWQHFPSQALSSSWTSPSVQGGKPVSHQNVFFSTVGAHSTPAWWNTSCGHTPPTLVSCTEPRACALVVFRHCHYDSSTQPPFSAPHFPCDACTGPFQLSQRLCAVNLVQGEWRSPAFPSSGTGRWTPREGGALTGARSSWSWSR